MKLSKINKVFMMIIVFVAISLLLSIVYLIQINENKKQASQTSAVLINQLEHIIANNKAKEDTLVASLKENYIAKAKTISYIIDNSPETAGNLVELIKIANLTQVDEIHLFNATGTIYGGTTPQYYGYSFDSGEQMAYFKPMLDDKKLTMCQDVVPNTAEEKPMMYAICWNDQGTQMLQVGIEPFRLMEELRVNDISEVVKGIATYAGITVVVADKASGEIQGATLSSLVGKKLDEIGMIFQGDAVDHVSMFEGSINGEESYYAVHGYGQYIVAVIQQRSIVDKDVPQILGIVAVYLFVAVIVSLLIIRKLTTRAYKEQKNATTDYMTGFLNRRGYENHIEAYNAAPPEENFVYVSMDLNGLKQINDTFGHMVGDEVIKAAASCMKACFGNYGDLFRIGGDEFVAMIVADDNQLEQIKGDFEKMTRNWCGNLVKGLSVSYGCVRGKEFPEKSLTEIAEIADMRMYQAKQEHYRVNGKDRRRSN